MSVESGVDPRVQIELEKLNTATDNINKFEVELDDAKCEFKKLLSQSVDRIKKSSHKLTHSIEVARPYYESRLYASQLVKETHQAAANYEKAKSVHAAAKEMVYLAEQGLGEKSTLDTACQEMLSHAASRVNESQLEVTETRNMLKICELKQEVTNSRVSKLQSQLKSAIKSSSFNIRRNLLLLNLLAYQHDLLILPYYETRANFNGLIKTQKKKISDLECKVSEAKMSYNDALKNLEKISEEIHRMRKERLNFNILTLNFDSTSTQQDQSNSFSIRTHSTEDSDDESFNYRENKFIFSSKIDNTDEYLDFPQTLSLNASPIRQRNLDQHDCPHLLHDFESAMKFTNESTSTASYRNKLTTDEQWTEIRLSESDSTSSGYSGRHNLITNGRILDDRSPTVSEASSSDDQKRITCTTVFNGTDYNDDDTLSKGEKSPKSKSGNEGGITSWISRSNSFKTSGRRQSLDLLLDAGDRVKDVLASSFQKVGKSLERRNSEEILKNSESNDFFSFTRGDKDQLTDEQVENLMLNSEDNLIEITGILNDGASRDYF